MDTFGTVNFEDLFDFSPEPLDASCSQQQQQQENSSQAANSQPQPSNGASGITTPAAAGNPGRGGGGSPSNQDQKQLNNFPTPLLEIGGTNFEEINSKSSAIKLSQSVPSNWGSHFPQQQQQQDFLNNSSEQSEASFNTTVGNLLQELPEQSASTGQKGKRGRKPGQKNLKTDMKTKLERSRQSARECRARKKLRYQYLDDLILEREKAIYQLRNELAQYQKWCKEMDANPGLIPEGLKQLMQQLENEKRGL